MPFTLRPFRRVPVQYAVTYNAGALLNLPLVSCLGFASLITLLVLVVGGCTEWTIPPCAGTPFKTPCVGPCTEAVEPVGPTYTRVTMPLAVVIQDQQGTLHCQEIKP